jgi:hypothetical protein
MQAMQYAGINFPPQWDFAVAQREIKLRSSRALGYV